MTLQTHPLPPIDWSITIPGALLFHERENAHLPMFTLARPDSEQSGSVTYGAFARACRRVPGVLGLTSEELLQRPVIAILAHTDTLIYQTIVIGLMLVGAVPFPISTRNAAGAVLHLLKASASRRLIMTSETSEQRSADILEGLISRDATWPSRISESPVLGQLYPTLADSSLTDDEDVPCNNEFSEPDINSPCIYLHSSGSTGLPKVVPKSHYEVVKYMKYPTATIHSNPAGRTQLACMELPPFHGMAWTFQLCVPLFHSTSTTILFPTVKSPREMPIAPDADTVIHLIDRTNPNSCVTIPAFLHLWVHNPKYIEILRKLDFVQYGGGSLSTTVGETLFRAGVKLRCFYGGSEFGGPAMAGLRPGDEADWEYLEIAEDAYPKFVDQGDDTYELQLISPEDRPLSVTNIPNVNGYATSDLFIRHPTKPHLWKLVGRIDDVIVHSSGEKTVPGPIEFIVQGCPYISGAVVFGAGRIQPGMLIELHDQFRADTNDPDVVRARQDLVWPFIEKANEAAPSFSQITKDMLIFTSPEKPLPRTPKLTVPMKASWNLYAEEIEKCYRNSRLNRWNNSSSIQPQSWEEDDIIHWLLRHIQDLSSGQDINTYDNLFQQGFDSIGATMLRRIISKAISARQETDDERGAALDVIYQYPSIRALARFLTGSIKENAESASTARVDAVESMISRYSFKNTSISISKHTPAVGQPTVVLITGSTGSLGSQVLAKLLSAATVAKVYTLNRPGAIPSAQRHVQRFKDVGLDEGLLRLPKLVHLEGSCENAHLGVSPMQYQEIKDSVTLIIHIAWRMDFNLSLDSFESVIQATCNLAALGLQIQTLRPIRFIFTSSVGIAQAWDGSLGPYPEQVVQDAKYAIGSGYGEAKYVCERILAASKLETTSIRISQMVGREENGAWTSYDWVSIMFQSSAALGGLPTTGGDISWISPDTVARSIMDLMNFTGSYPQALNVVNPQPITWDDMIGNIQQAIQLECGTHLPLIPYEDWLSALENSAFSVHDAGDVNRIPAVKLANFFHRLSRKKTEGPLPGETEAFNSPTFSTDRHAPISGTLWAQPPMTKQAIHMWVQYWAKKGILPGVRSTTV